MSRGVLGLEIHGVVGRMEKEKGFGETRSTSRICVSSLKQLELFMEDGSRFL